MSEATEADAREPAARELGTQALDRALGVLLSFRGDDVERKVTDVSRELGLHKSTASRMFRAFADAGFLQRNEDTGGYRLGVAVFELGARYLAGLDLHAVARPLLHRLAEEEGESVNFGIIDGGDVFSIYVVQGTKRPQLVSRMGRRIPVWCSAGGKALLAGHTDDEIRALLADAPLTALTRRTITDAETFVAGMAAVRKRGWALNDEESEDGLRVVSAPVHDRFHAVTASISVSGPIFRLDDARVQQLAAAVTRTATELSRQLGDGVVVGLGEIFGG